MASSARTGKSIGSMTPPLTNAAVSTMAAVTAPTTGSRLRRRVCIYARNRCSGIKVHEDIGTSGGEGHSKYPPVHSLLVTMETRPPSLPVFPLTDDPSICTLMTVHSVVLCFRTLSKRDLVILLPWCEKTPGHTEGNDLCTSVK